MKLIKEYKDYDEYVTHQGSKARKINEWLETYHYGYIEQLYDRIKDYNFDWRKYGLCLGARTGAECIAFKNKELDFVGIDLNPVKRAYQVLIGDFHKIQFRENSFDVVFTNSFDHALKIDTMIKEIVRVLNNKGWLIFEANYGSKEGGNFAEYEVLEWEYIEELITLLKTYGFKLISDKEIVKPWKGKHVVMELIK